MLYPFARLLRRDARIPRQTLDALEAMDADERVPIATVHDLLAATLLLTGDENIGLRAAREFKPGDYGAVEYVARSASTWADACEVLGRYVPLVNDALRFSTHAEGTKLRIQFDATLPLPRAVADFQSAAFIIAGKTTRPLDFAPEYGAYFSHTEPEDLSEYRDVFAGAALHFSAGFNGFVVDLEYNTMRLESADPNLHSLLRKHADAMLAELPSANRLIEQVRDLLMRELQGGTPTLHHIARKLSLGDRTLSRRLSDDGTTFKAQLDDLRERLARRYLSNSDLAISEITFLLGFSKASAFHRAFRRWTGQTPLEFRQAAASKR
jgi:AraC-like DNA-binding protein